MLLKALEESLSLAKFIQLNCAQLRFYGKVEKQADNSCRVTVAKRPMRYTKILVVGLVERHGSFLPTLKNSAPLRLRAPSGINDKGKDGLTVISQPRPMRLPTQRTTRRWCRAGLGRKPLDNLAICCTPTTATHTKCCLALRRVGKFSVRMHWTEFVPNGGLSFMNSVLCMWRSWFSHRK